MTIARSQRSICPQGKDLIQVGQVFGTNPNLSVAEDIDGIDLTAAGDTIDLNPPITRGFLSKGVTQSPHGLWRRRQRYLLRLLQQGQLRLEGESGNDVFTIRSFQFDASTIINGGDGDDLIEYNVNAPVNINGGKGSIRSSPWVPKEMTPLSSATPGSEVLISTSNWMVWKNPSKWMAWKATTPSLSSVPSTIPLPR
jgi:Ca2+-binding RTX toxin-like protein